MFQSRFEFVLQKTVRNVACRTPKSAKVIFESIFGLIMLTLPAASLPLLALVLLINFPSNQNQPPPAVQAVAPAHDDRHVSARSESLTASSWIERTGNRTVFVLFRASWCSHCQSFLPSWNQFVQLYEEHTSKIQLESNPSSPREEILLADVDCYADVETQRWCAEIIEISGFPSIKFGDPSHQGIFLETYQGDLSPISSESSLGRDATKESGRAQQLFQYVTKDSVTLTKPLCTAGTTAGCDSSKKREIKIMWQMSLEQLDKAIASKERVIDSLLLHHEKSMAYFQKLHDKFAHAFATKTARAKRNIRLLMSLKHARVNRTGLADQSQAEGQPASRRNNSSFKNEHSGKQATSKTQESSSSLTPTSSLSSAATPTLLHNSEL
jgi:thiol-disulfide isomerase/thioredoxin